MEYWTKQLGIAVTADAVVAALFLLILNTVPVCRRNQRITCGIISLLYLLSFLWLKMTVVNTGTENCEAFELEIGFWTIIATGFALHGARSNERNHVSFSKIILGLSAFLAVFVILEFLLPLESFSQWRNNWAIKHFW